MKKFKYIVFAFSLFPIFGNSQSLTDSIFIMPDSVRPFTLENFYLLITKNHPVAKQAGLLNEFARQEIRLARGNFDPKIEIQYNKSLIEFKGETKLTTILIQDNVSQEVQEVHFFIFFLFNIELG